MPEENEKKPKEADASKEQPKVKKETSPLVKKLILAGIILVVVAIQAFVAYYMVQATKQEDPRILAEQKEKEQEEAAREKQTSMGMTTEPIDVIVNISGSNEDDRYAKVAVQLEFDNIKYPMLEEQLVLRTPKIKNILIEQLSNHQAEELVSQSGKTKLRQSILREVNKTLPRNIGAIREVYLSEFILQ